MAKLKIEFGNASGLLCNFQVYIDDEFKGKYKANTNAFLTLDAGTHSLVIKDSGMLKNSKPIDFEIENDKTKFISVNTGKWKYVININDNNDEEFSDLNITNKELQNIIDINISQDEKVELAIKGVFKEYLICTDKKVYIIKKGFMTGHFFGKGNFSIPYSKITNVEIDFHLMTGYFEISTGGLENKRLNYWSNDAHDDPSKQPNCISLNSACKKEFEDAKQFIFDKLNSFNPNIIENKGAKSIPEQIREYKQLLDDGIISSDEFEKKKEELLSKKT